MMKSNPLGALATVVAIGAWYNINMQLQDERRERQEQLENERREREREIDHLHQDVMVLRTLELTRTPDLQQSNYATLKASCKDKLDKPEFHPRDEDPDAGAVH